MAEEARVDDQGILVRTVEAIGSAMLDLVSAAGTFGLFVARLFRETIPGLRYVGLIAQQCKFVGNDSMVLIVLTAVFVGGVSALQSAYQFHGQVPLMYVGTVIAKSVLIELGPVLTALIVGARVSASFAAELGSMRVTEQIDALETLGIRPVRYLVVPRFIAGMVMMPVATVFSEALEILGGLLVAVTRVGLSVSTFTRGTKIQFNVHDVYGGFIKAFVFGGVIAIAGCYFGYTTKGGAEGVGISTTKAVVTSLVMVLVLDYFLAEVIFRLLFS